MSALESAVRRLIDERNRNQSGVAYRADLWNDVWFALAPPPAMPALPPRVAPAGAEVRP